MFTLAIFCLTTFNLPWFLDLTFQAPMQYCSLQLWTLLLSPVTSTTGCCFYFGSILSFFLELFLHWSPVAFWAPTNLESSSYSVLFFLLFILFMEFSRQEYWSSLNSILQWTTFCPLIKMKKNFSIIRLQYFKTKNVYFKRYYYWTLVYHISLHTEEDTIVLNIKTVEKQQLTHTEHKASYKL